MYLTLKIIFLLFWIFSGMNSILDSDSKSARLSSAIVFTISSAALITIVYIFDK